MQYTKFSNEGKWLFILMAMHIWASLRGTLISPKKEYKTFASLNIVKAHLNTLPLYEGASSKERDGGRTLRNELDDEIM